MYTRINNPSGLSAFYSPIQQKKRCKAKRSLTPPPSPTSSNVRPNLCMDKMFDSVQDINSDDDLKYSFKPVSYSPCTHVTTPDAHTKIRPHSVPVRHTFTNALAANFNDVALKPLKISRKGAPCPTNTLMRKIHTHRCEFQSPFPTRYPKVTKSNNVNVSKCHHFSVTSARPYC